MILSCTWISLPCLSSSVIIRFLPRLCVLTFFKLFDASIVSRISSKLCLRISSLPFFFMVLHISKYSMWSLGVLFTIISLCFFIRALVGDDIFGFFCFLVCFAGLIALCWIISVMFLFRLSMSSHSSSVITTKYLSVQSVGPLPYTVADRGVSGPWGPQICEALC